MKIKEAIQHCTDENESMFADTFSQCDGCPDWDGTKCKSGGHGCEGGGPEG